MSAFFTVSYKTVSGLRLEQIGMDFGLKSALSGSYNIFIPKVRCKLYKAISDIDLLSKYQMPDTKKTPTITTNIL